MPRTTSPLIAALAAVLFASPLGARVHSPGPQKPRGHTTAKGEARSPQRHLDEAGRVLNRIPAAALTADAGRKFSDLKRDFGELEMAYLAQVGVPAGLSAVGSSTTGSTTGTSTGSAPIVGAMGSVASATVGTTGSAAARSPLRPVDWRAKYSAVDRDITELTTSGDTTTRSLLREFRSHLQMFSAATAGLPQRDDYASAVAMTTAATATSRPPASTSSTSPGGTQTNEARALLDRIDTIVSDALETPKFDSSEAGKVSIERARLDEIKAEVAQLKLMLKDK